WSVEIGRCDRRILWCEKPCLIGELVEWSLVLRIGPSNCVGEHISVVHDHWVTVDERLLGNCRYQRWHKALSRYSPRSACRGHCAWDQSNCGPACQHLTCSPFASARSSDDQSEHVRNKGFTLHIPVPERESSFLWAVYVTR